MQQPENPTEPNDFDFRRIGQAIAYLQSRYLEQPTLGDVANAIGLSESRTQRLFTQWAGISPKRFVQHLTSLQSTALLQRGRNVLDATYATGLSGPARLHDLMVNVHAATPGEVASGGAGIEISWGITDTPFGSALLAVTARGICALHFLGPMTESEALADVRARWPAASMVRDDGVALRTAASVFHRAGGAGAPLSVLISGTNFQMQVWRALLSIPPGSAASYGDVATKVGSPSAGRAVGTAVGANAVAFLIPCHRVIRKVGGLGDYRWGADRKPLMLAWEMARTGTDE